MSRIVLLGGVLLMVIGGTVWFTTRPPDGIETMSGDDPLMEWISLASTGLGFATSLIGLIATFRKK